MIDVYGYSIATIPIIVSLVYGIIEFMKHFVFTNVDAWGKYIPVVAAALGCAISICFYFFSPDLLPVPTWYAAVIMGMASGLSAVGVNQIKKQMSNGGEKSGS
jgi:uncharacterized membrane protein (DUF2068 family)